MRKNILLPKDFSDLTIQEEEGYYHFWLNERCVGYAWRTRTGFATADRPLENLIKSLTPYIKSFDEQINLVGELKGIAVQEVTFPAIAETVVELRPNANIYNELLAIKQLLGAPKLSRPQKLTIKQAKEEFLLELN
ncbi:MAG: hypothetical protein EOO91_10395 [Pedobacter sp.]|nr:MAG: hypothetical protein EOO91_10395 [Pedobacter sp.]